MAEVQHIGLDEIVDYFDELEDPRSPTNLKHPLVSVGGHRNDGGACRC